VSQGSPLARTLASGTCSFRDPASLAVVPYPVRHSRGVTGTKAESSAAVARFPRLGGSAAAPSIEACRRDVPAQFPSTVSTLTGTVDRAAQ